MNQTARQIGGALGIATLVALIGSQRHLADPLDGFHQLWAFAAATAVISGVIGSFIPRPAPHQAAAITTSPTSSSPSRLTSSRSRSTGRDRHGVERLRR